METTRVASNIQFRTEQFERLVFMEIHANASVAEKSNVRFDCEAVIINTLLKLGVPANTKGFHYLKTALYFAIENPIALTSMSKIVYPAISAQYYAASAYSIERAMRYAISQSCQRGNTGFILRIFGYPEDMRAYLPTNREFLAVVAEYIRQILRNMPASRVEHTISA